MSEIHEDFARKLHGFSRFFMRRWRDADRTQGLGPAQFSVLGALVQFQQPLSLKRLAEIERVSAATMSRIVRSLEENGWVRRGEVADRRLSMIAATAAGKRLYASAQKRRLDMIQAFVAGLKPETLEDLSRALDRLLMQIENVTD